MKDNLKNMFKEVLKEELKYLKGEDFEVNQHGNYIFVSQNNNQLIDLAHILADYKNYLMKNDLI